MIELRKLKRKNGKLKRKNRILKRNYNELIRSNYCYYFIRTLSTLNTVSRVYNSGKY